MIKNDLQVNENMFLDQEKTVLVQTKILFIFKI